MFSNGVIFLAVLAGALLVAFKGNISSLIPLYAFGVFTGFTLSQAGMVVHHVRRREPRWRLSSVINAVGCMATGVVAIIVVVSKFTEGAWIPAVLIPLLVVWFRSIHRHYAVVSEVLRVDTDFVPARRRNLVVVLVGTVNRGVVEAVQYARSLYPDRLLAVSIVTDPRDQERLVDAWVDHRMPIPLHTISSPYRELVRPVLDYLDELAAEEPDQVVTVVIPEFVTPWRSQWLHNQSALALKAKLLYRPDTVVTSVPVVVSD